MRASVHRVHHAAQQQPVGVALQRLLGEPAADPGQAFDGKLRGDVGTLRARAYLLASGAVPQRQGERVDQDGLPAPVSPVSAVNPGRNSRSSPSTIANPGSTG